MKDNLAPLQLKPHNFFIGAVIVFPYLGLQCQLEFNSSVGDRAGVGEYYCS